MPRPGGIIASTEGDVEVAPDWLSQTLRAFAGGAEAVGGRIRTKRGTNHDSEAQRYARQDELYQRGLACLESLIDPSLSIDGALRHPSGRAGISGQPFCLLWERIMEHHAEAQGAWARRWPLWEITHALPDLKMQMAGGLRAGGADSLRREVPMRQAWCREFSNHSDLL